MVVTHRLKPSSQYTNISWLTAPWAFKVIIDDVLLITNAIPIQQIVALFGLGDLRHPEDVIGARESFIAFTMQVQSTSDERLTPKVPALEDD